MSDSVGVNGIPSVAAQAHRAKEAGAQLLLDLERMPAGGQTAELGDERGKQYVCTLGTTGSPSRISKLNPAVQKGTAN
jgi:hypothetical protein